MQLQLLTGALRRRPEFTVTACRLDPELILKSLEVSRVDVVLLAASGQGSTWQDMALLRRIHISYPRVPKILVLEALDRELVVNAFRSGARGLFCFLEIPFPGIVQMHPGCTPRPDLGNC